MKGTVLSESTVMLASDDAVVAVFQCGKGNIHLVYRHVNIGMQPHEYLILNERLQQVRLQVERGEWPSSSLALCYGTTLVTMGLSDLDALAYVMGTAADTVERLEVIQDGDSLPPDVPPSDPGCGPGHLGVN